MEMDVRALQRLPEDELAELMEGLDDEALEEVKDALRQAETERVTRMDALGAAIAQRRAEAIAARQTSGIEDEWLADEEFYEGIDDANRGESSAWTSKPPGQEMVNADDTSSTIFLNVTGPYCDAASASLADMLLPTDDSAWQLEPTPVAELIPFADGEFPPQVRDQIRNEANQAQPDNPDGYAARKEEEIAGEARRILDEAKEKAQKAQNRIEDWHVECQYHAEVRKVIEDTAKVGSGVLKGPVPTRRRQVAYMDGGLVIQEDIKPASRRIDYRNLYPDAGCGDSIHNGSYIFERDDITEKQLRELIGTPGYDEGQILTVLDEGPTESDGTYRPDVEEMRKRDTKSLYEIWYYYGDIKKEDLEAAGCECDEEQQDGIPAQLAMINNRVIKAAFNPLDTGEFPYDVMVWKKRNGTPWGTGVARLIRTPQRMINGAARNLMDNAGLAGGPMWAFKPGVLEPMDGVAELAPRKGWIASEDADLEHMSNAFAYFKLDMMVEELQAIIYLGLKMAEDVTGLPMIMQGQMGAQKLDTLGQTQLLNNNANIVRRRIARLFDDLVTEPHVRRYYAYLLQYGEDEEKGEFTIDARGSSNLVERAVQKEKTMEWLELAQNPVYGIDPKRVAKELLRADKFDPKAFEYDDEEWRELVAKLSQQQDPGSEVKAAEIQLKQAEQQFQQQKWQAEEQRERQKQQFDQQYQSAKLQSDQEIARQEMALKRGLTLAELEAKLGIQSQQLELKAQETTAKLQNQRDLEAAKLTDSQNERQARERNRAMGYDSWG